MLLHMLGCCMGCGAGAAGVGDVTERDGDVGEGDDGLAGAEYVLEPRLPDEERLLPARAEASSGIRKQRKKKSVKSISPFNTQRFVDITPPDLAYIGLSCLFSLSGPVNAPYINLPRPWRERVGVRGNNPLPLSIRYAI
jgi:hypothetical protein